MNISNQGANTKRARRAIPVIVGIAVTVDISKPSRTRDTKDYKFYPIFLNTKNPYQIESYLNSYILETDYHYYIPLIFSLSTLLFSFFFSNRLAILLSPFRHPFKRAISFSMISTYCIYFSASTGTIEIIYCIS